MLARVPLAFALCLDPRTVNQKGQKASPTAIGDGDAQRLLTTGFVAQIRLWIHLMNPA